MTFDPKSWTITGMHFESVWMKLRPSWRVSGREGGGGEGGRGTDGRHPRLTYSIPTHPQVLNDSHLFSHFQLSSYLTLLLAGGHTPFQLFSYLILLLAGGHTPFLARGNFGLRRRQH